MGELGKVQGRDPVGIEEGSCGYRARAVCIHSKHSKPGVQDWRVALWLNVVLTHEGTECELRVLSPPLPHGVSVFR